MKQRDIALVEVVMDTKDFKVKVAELEFAMRVEMNVLVPDEEGMGEEITRVKPGLGMDSAYAEAFQAAEMGDHEKFRQWLDQYLAYQVFDMLGVKALPPVLQDGGPSDYDFEYPQYVKVVKTEE